MRHRNIWWARIEQAAEDAEIGKESKMEALLDEIEHLQKSRDAAIKALEDCVYGLGELKSEIVSRL